MGNEQQGAGPLSGIRVLDFSRILSGPYATQILADLGAEVIKVETVDKGDETRHFPPFQGDLSHYFIALNRGKKSIALNLKSERGAQLARELAAKVDIVVENFRPGVMDKLGLGYDVLAKDNSGLLYCSISGFGSDSPLSDKPAFDIVAQALSGIMSINREAGAAPNRLGIPLGDMAGGIFGLFGILAALVERERTGKGQRIDVAMLDGLMGMLGYLAQIYFVTGKAPEPVGTKHPNIVPYGAYPASDGHVIVACLTEQFWHNFARALEKPELISDPRFAEYAARLENRALLEEIVEERMRGNDKGYWLDRLREFDVPSAPILDVGEALEQAHTSQSDLVGTSYHEAVGEMQYLRTPIRFAGKPLDGSTPPPLLGEQTADVLSDFLGIDEREIEELSEQSVAFQRS
ncbi:CaiB/BaiF CoA transferase family protein [Roseibium sp.]|uniref:CaiB/BaiF CoA transferase family protein n=1 Tax=Roseibium sp. TaxID=1936156 RepID=UPI003A96B40D